MPSILPQDGATDISNSSGNKANATATGTLTPASNKTAFITGFEVTATGATSATVVLVTITGLSGGTLSYVLDVPATTALVQLTPLIVAFTTPMSGLAPGQAIAVSCPALGSGNTNCVVNARGYQA